MIDIRKLKELVRLMVSSGLTELDLRDSEEQVTLRRQTAVAGHLPGSPAGAHPGAAAVAFPHAAEHGEAIGAVIAEDDSGAAEPSSLLKIESPMVGTFYGSPEPDAAPFIGPGTSVSPETVVCIIEAMKIFNEIKAECSGTIRKVLVKNGEAVEFGQPLFLVEPG